MAESFRFAADEMSAGTGLAGNSRCRCVRQKPDEARARLGSLVLDMTALIQCTDMEFAFANVDADGCNSHGSTLLMLLWIDSDAPKVAREGRTIPLDGGVNLQTLSNREKTLLVDALKDSYRLSELLKAVQLPRSSYYYQREALERPDKYAEARQAIATIFENNYRCYGYRRIGESLRRDGAALSEKVVRRLMSEEGLVVGSTQRRRFSSYRGELSPAPGNLIARDFQASAPNEKWLTDITEFPMPHGKVYLSPMIDCFDGLAVSWSISAPPNADLVNAMLDEAISTLAPGERPVVHSDRGCRYRWPGWLKRLEAADLTRSMSRKGCTPDNAACEAFFGRLKVEFFYARQWTGTTMEQFVAELDAYLRWYNESRIKMSLSGRSPIE